MKARFRFPIAALVLLLVGGCAARTVPPPSETTPPAGPPSAPVAPPVAVPPPPPVAPPVPVPPPPPAVSPAEQDFLEGQSLMQEGKFERALELFAGVWKDTPGHPGVEETFPAALEGLKKSGDEARRQGQLGEAGKRWTAAMRFLSHPAMKGRSPSFTRADLKSRTDKVSETLMEQGLEDYRQGRLEAAIAHWRQILAYDPSHEEAAKSVKTATTQLENLKKITPPNAVK